MSKIKYISFFKKDAVFDSERIASDLLDVCEQIDLGKDDAICKIQVVQGELVHCKDCKYSTETDAYGLRVCRRMCGLSGFTDHDFCSKGERRDE